MNFTVKTSELEGALPGVTISRINKCVREWAEVKQHGGLVTVVIGSGPHLHEGVTVLLSGMIRKGLIDGVITSSAVCAHEIAGILEYVKRVRADNVGIEGPGVPLDGVLEVAQCSESDLAEMGNVIDMDMEYFRILESAPGHSIIKAAGNIAYPTGLWSECISEDICNKARKENVSWEKCAGMGCDPKTLLGACARKSVPFWVSVPQLIGGGSTGLLIGDSCSITERTLGVAKTLEKADLIIESGLALAQEIHDGPWECATGHGIWAAYRKKQTFSLKDKHIYRIDLDKALDVAWKQQRSHAAVSNAVDKGSPKTKSLGIPFRMEMSGFCRLPHSVPIIGDLAVIWPLLAIGVEEALGIELPFVSAPQNTPEGKKMREWIVENVRRWRPQENLPHVEDRLA